jgi:hypothetical protein
MARRTAAAGVKMLLVLGPQRIQVSLLDPTVRPSGVDPYEIGRRLAAIAARHGILFQDTLEGFANTPDSDAFFYAVDGHMDADGHAIFARSALARLTHDAPAFRDCQNATTAESSTVAVSKAWDNASRLP